MTISEVFQRHYMKLLYISAAGYSTAIGFTAGRWLLKETGEIILLLFFHENGNIIEREMGGEYFCANEQHREGKEIAHDTTPLQTVGHTILSVASSPVLRAVILLVFVVSSTTLLVGIVIIVDQFQQIKSRMLSSIENSKEKFCRQVLLPTINCMDQLVLDDVLQIVVKRGMEMWFGMFGGVLLYSVPPLPMLGGVTEDEDDTATISKEVRRRILCATDPSLDRVMFYPGGVWEMLSSNLRDYLVKTMTPTTMRRQHQICSKSTTTTEMVLDENSSEQDDDDDDASFDTPLVSSVPLSEMTSPSRGNDSNCNIHHPVNSRQTIQDDLLQQQRRKKRRVVIQPPLPTSPPPPVLLNDWHLERILRRTSLVTTILFVYHLHRSPNTRKAWGYMVHSLTSLGLVSTAVSAGLSSLVLQSNPSFSDGIVNPIMNAICATVMGRQRWNNMMMVQVEEEEEQEKVSKGNVPMKSILLMFRQLRNEIQRKKRYYLAILMLYGMSSLSRRRIRSRVGRIVGRS